MDKTLSPYPSNQIILPGCTFALSDRNDITLLLRGGGLAVQLCRLQHYRHPIDLGIASALPEGLLALTE